MRRSLLLIVSLLVALVPPPWSAAQSFNIDLGIEHGPPPVTYGGAAGQLGVWNSLPAGSHLAVGLLGNFTGVLVDVTAAADGFAGLTAGDAALLFGDNLFDCVDPDLWTVEFSNLLNGFYDVFLYAPQNPAVSLGDTIAAGVAAPSIPGDQAANVAGLTFHRLPATVVAGTLAISADATRESDCAGIAGIQLVYRGPVPPATSSFNVDLGMASGVPGMSYAAAGTPGTWNALGRGSHQLVDRHGVLTGVTLDVVAVTDSGAGSPIPGNGGALFGDNIFGCGGAEWSLILSGLPDDLYRVDLYVPSNALVSTGEVLLNSAAVGPLAGGPQEPVAGSSWVSLELEVLGATLSITGSSPTGCAGLAGLQIAPSFLFIDGFESGDSARWAPAAP